MENSSSHTENKAEMMTISVSEYESLKSEISELNAKVEWFMEQFRLSRKKEFGSSSEKSEYYQYDLFNEAEATADDNICEPELAEVKRHYRKKAKESSGRLPDDIPVFEIIHDLDKEDLICPECSGMMEKIGKTHRDELVLVPAKAFIRRHIRITYGCRDHDGHDDYGTPITKAQVDEPVIKGSFASLEAIAHIMCQKFEMGLPLYRQEQDWARRGIPLSRQTMSNWLLKSTEDWLSPLYEMICDVLRQQSVLHADETTLQVLHEEGKSPQSKSYMWLYRTGRDANAHIVLFDYQPDRKAKRPKEFLKDYKGYLHTDGYEVYHGLPKDIIVVGCFAHARRKFIEALDSLSDKDRAGSLALVGKNYCDELFRIERELNDLPPEERLLHRQKRSKPMLEAFKHWIDTTHPTAKTKIGVAMRYARNEWNYLERYMLDGRLEISNNRAERSIKPFVIGRKNFLFANTSRGAKCAAMIYSIIQTAKENGLDAYEYLTYVFSKGPKWDIQNNPDMLNEILPWMPWPQQHCKKPAKNHSGAEEAV